jgi:hypothetical protein
MEAGYVSISNSHGGGTGAIAIADGRVRAISASLSKGLFAGSSSYELSQTRRSALAAACQLCPCQLKSKLLLRMAEKSQQETHPP